MILQQKYLCCYCCRLIDSEHSHNEHIRPRELYPQLSMDYRNLLASCTSDSCGMAKAGKYDERRFVSPLSEDCEKHFRYEEDGYIVGTTEMGKYTVELLRLNTYALVNARKSLFKECCEMARYCGREYIQSEYVQEKEGKLPRFADMVSYFDSYPIQEKRFSTAFEEFCTKLSQRYDVPADKIELIANEVLLEIDRRRHIHSKTGPRTQAWDKLDEKLFPKVKKIVDGILAVEGRPQKVTIGKIQDALGLPDKQIDKLVRCKKYILDHKETQKEYWAREVVWAVHKIESETQILNWKRIRTMTNMRRSDLSACVSVIAACRRK